MLKKINFIYNKGVVCIILLTIFCVSLYAGAGSPLQMQEAYAAVAQKAMPAVVTVYNLKYAHGNYSHNGTGSGFFVSKQGHIVTNFHVVAHADALAVKLADGNVMPAAIVGVSQDTDLAVLKVNGKRPFPHLKFADTRKVKVGHYAIAIGSPFSLSQTMTTGIVSHKGRALGKHFKEDYIQTDASINPGNSGGPLLNITGEVIGVNDCILSPGNRSNSPGSIGIGFAIDGNLASRVVKKIINIPQKTMPSAGIVLEGSTAITKVLPKSPAARAKLKAGDVIIQIDNKKVVNTAEIQKIIISFYNPGDSAVFIIKRNGKLLKKTIKFDSAKM